MAAKSLLLTLAGTLHKLTVMEKLAEHSFEPSILTPAGWVLDGGCRGFKFARGMAERGMRVLAVDPGPPIADPKIRNVTFRRVALAVTDGEANYVLGNGIGNFVCGEETPSYAKVVHVPTITLARLMSEQKIGCFDLIKLDIEGGEYSVLMELPPGCCRQLSVEFHDFIGRNPEPEPEAYYHRLRQKLSDFDFTYHVKVPTLWPPHKLAYVDSVLIHKEAIKSRLT